MHIHKKIHTDTRAHRDTTSSSNEHYWIYLIFQPLYWAVETPWSVILWKQCICLECKKIKGRKTKLQEQREIESHLETGILLRGCLCFKAICGFLGILLTLEFLNNTLLNMPRGLTLKCIKLKMAMQKHFLRGQAFTGLQNPQISSPTTCRESLARSEHLEGVSPDCSASKSGLYIHL